VRYRDAIAKPGGPETFAGEQGIEDFRPGDALVVFEQKPGLLKDTLFAAGIKTNDNVGQRN
jgi:hypothetical protein